MAVSSGGLGEDGCHNRCAAVLTRLARHVQARLEGLEVGLAARVLMGGQLLLTRTWEAASWELLRAALEVCGCGEAGYCIAARVLYQLIPAIFA